MVCSTIPTLHNFGEFFSLFIIVHPSIFPLVVCTDINVSSCMCVLFAGVSR